MAAAVVAAALAAGGFLLGGADHAAVVNAPVQTLASPITGRIETPLPDRGERVTPGHEVVVSDTRRVTAGAAQIEQRIARLDSERLRLQAEISARAATVRRLSQTSAAAARPPNDSLADRVQRTRDQVQRSNWNASQARADLLWLSKLKREGRPGADGEPISNLDILEAQQKVRETEERLRAERGKLSALEYAYGATINGQLDSIAQPTAAETQDRSGLLQGELDASRQRQEALLALRHDLREDLLWLRQSGDDQGTARIAAPTGLVWRRTDGGENVLAGAELGAVADCTRTVVTAALSERRLRGLPIGTPARIRIAKDSEQAEVLYGRVTDLDPARPDDGSRFAVPIPGDTDGEIHGVIVTPDQPQQLGCRLGTPVRLDFSERYAVMLLGDR